MNRSFCVGVTGHRWNGLQEADAPHLRRQVYVVLESVQQTIRRLDPVRSLQLLSPLAEGSDRIVASIALDLGYSLQCVLPFARASYEEDFETQGSKEEFRNLLARAAAVIEPPTLPTVGAQRDAAYTAVGRRVTAKSHLLLAIWDGQEARGEGGTGQMVGEALEASHAVVWIHAKAPHNAYLLASDGSQEGMSGLPVRIAGIVRRGEGL